MTPGIEALIGTAALFGFLWALYRLWQASAQIDFVIKNTEDK